VARSTSGRWANEQVAAYEYQPTPYGGPDTYQPGRRRGGAIPAPRQAKAPADDLPPKAAKTRLDEWMEVDFKFGGSRIKRKAVALVLLGIPAVAPLFFMLPALITLNSTTFSGSVDDTLGTGAEFCLILCLLITPLAMLTGQHWFIPLRRWYGIMMAASGIGDAAAAGVTDNFAGGVFGRLTGHTFTLVGFMMVMLVVPLVFTSNPWAQRKLGRYWKRFQRLTYAIWALLACHLMLLEGFGFERGDNGSGFAGDGDPIFHQRLYQFSACSLFLLVLRLPPVKRWIAARQKEGRDWLVWVAVLPLLALFIFGLIFIINEEIFKGIDSFTEHPSAE